MALTARSSTFQNLSQIVRDYPPLKAPEQQSSKKQTRSTPLEEPPYPPEWIVDSSLVCCAIYQFEHEYTTVEQPLPQEDDLATAESVDTPEAPRKPHPRPLLSHRAGQPSAADTRPLEQPIRQPLSTMAGLTDEQLRVISTAVAAAVTSTQQADCSAHPTLTSHGCRA